MNSQLYDRLKFIAQIFLPALGTLYFSLAEIWGLPAAEQVVGTIVVVDTFLGVVLQLSSHSYAKSEKAYDGSLEITKREGGTKSFLLNLDGDPEKLEDKDVVRFKVKPLERHE